MAVEYDYREAFDRNLGLLTEEEQKRLRYFTVAIPGMGAMGGGYLVAMVRQGFQRFKIADFDSYELANFNRQYGATIGSLGKPKATVMRAKAHEINPHCEISVYDDGVRTDNLDEFLEGASIVMDGLNFFELDARRMIINRALRLGIPAITCSPVDFGMSSLTFLPGGRDFDDYFGIDDEMPYEEALLRFTLNTLPDVLRRRRLSGARFGEKMIASSITGVQLATAVGTVNALKVLLCSGKIKPVPYCHQYDAALDRHSCKKISMWHNSPLKWLQIERARKRFFGSDMPVEHVRPAEDHRGPRHQQNSELLRHSDTTRWRDVTHR